jgi:hypothetical protein
MGMISSSQLRCLEGERARRRRRIVTDTEMWRAMEATARVHIMVRCKDAIVV